MRVTVKTEDDGTHRATVPADGLRCCELGHRSGEAAALHAWELVEALRPREARRTRELRLGG